MNHKKPRTKFTQTLLFKLLCGTVLIAIVVGAYNLFSGSDEAATSQEAMDEEQQWKADLDTVDVIGNYLWPRMRASKEDMTSEEDKKKDADEDKTADGDAHGKKNGQAEHEAKSAPVPEPATVPTEPQDIQVKQAVPTVEKMAAPKIEHVE